MQKVGNFLFFLIKKMEFYFKWQFLLFLMFKFSQKVLDFDLEKIINCG